MPVKTNASLKNSDTFLFSLLYYHPTKPKNIGNKRFFK